MVSGIIEFATSLGSVIMIRGVTITPKKSAVIKLLYADDGMLEKHTLTMEGADYQAWGNDDDYLGHFCISQLTNGRATIVGNDYVAPPRATPVTYDDNRSVHNDSDLARIQTLQEQLDAQALKLKTITDLLFKNGSI
jgi:hypothetical protein